MFDLLSLDFIPKENMLAAAAAKSRGDTSGGQEGLQPNESEPAEGNDAECEEEEDPVEDDPPQDVQDVE